MIIVQNFHKNFLFLPSLRLRTPPDIIRFAPVVFRTFYFPRRNRCFAVTMRSCSAASLRTSTGCRSLLAVARTVSLPESRFGCLRTLVPGCAGDSRQVETLPAFATACAPNWLSVSSKPFASSVLRRLSSPLFLWAWAVETVGVRNARCSARFRFHLISLRVSVPNPVLYLTLELHGPHTHNVVIPGVLTVPKSFRTLWTNLFRKYRMYFELSTRRRTYL